MGRIALLSAFCLGLIGVILATSSPSSDLKLLLSLISGVLLFTLGVSFRCWRQEVA